MYFNLIIHQIRQRVNHHSFKFEKKKGKLPQYDRMNKTKRQNLQSKYRKAPIVFLFSFPLKGGQGQMGGKGIEQVERRERDVAEEEVERNC